MSNPNNRFDPIERLKEFSKRAPDICYKYMREAFMIGWNEGSRNVPITDEHTEECLTEVYSNVIKREFVKPKDKK